MVLTVQQWGNSLAVRLSKPLAKQIRVRKGSQLNLSVVNHKLILSPEREIKYELKSLLAKMRTKYSEQNTGLPVGREAW